MRSLGGGRAGEIRITRFLHNAKVNIAEMITRSATATAARVAGLHVLAIQETSVLRDDGKQRSLAVHRTLAV